MNQIIGQVKSDVVFHRGSSFKHSIFCIPLKPAPLFYIKIITKYASFNDYIRSPPPFASTYVSLKWRGLAESTRGSSLKTSSRDKLNRPSLPPPFRRKNDNGHKYTAISYTHTLCIVYPGQSDTLFSHYFWRYTPVQSESGLFSRSRVTR